MSERKTGTQERLTTSWMSRGLKMAGTMAKVTAKRMLGGGDGTGAGEELYGRLGELKGVMLKIGQMASYIQGSLPPGMQQALAKLQDTAPAMAPHLVERVVSEELGGPPQGVFAAWSASPSNAASIGQVHRATLADGTEVAVKVQYPQIVAALQGDLRNIDLVMSLAGAAYPGLDAAAIKDEIRSHFLAECDYRREAANQELFRNLYLDDSRVTIPEVFPQLSTGRVLTTRWVQGRKFADFVASASQEARNRAGEAIFWFAFHSIFGHGLFNCDPHPGNYLFAEDGRVVFLDFGCVKRFEPAFLRNWRDLIAAALAGERRRFDELVVSGGITLPGAKVDFDYHYQMSLQLYRPFLLDQPFRFTSEYVTAMSEAVGARNPNKRKLSMPRDFIFVNRLQWGLYSVLAALGAEANFHRLFMQIPAAGPSSLSAALSSLPSGAPSSDQPSAAALATASLSR